jgi:hypothetical protein
MRMKPDTNGIADLMYSTYLGANDWDWGQKIASVNDTTIIIVGLVLVSNFPVTPGAYDTTFNGASDVYIARFGTYVGITEGPNDPAIATLNLGPIYPNPSHGWVIYNVNLAHDTHVKIAVFDVTGRLVETLMDRQLTAGIHEFTWRPSEGIASGTYFIRLRTGEHSETRKVLFLK